MVPTLKAHIRTIEHYTQTRGCKSMSGTPLPAAGYISDPSRTVEEAQAEWELDISVTKTGLGGFSEGSTLSITSNSITPVSTNCVYPVDATGGGTINTIQTTNVRDGEVIFLHCVTSGDPITIANLASGSGAPIATFSGGNITLSDSAQFISLKFNATANQFQEMFPYPTWAAPGAIGSTTPNTGTFTSLTLTGNVGAGSLLGNFSGSSAAPSFNSPGSADQILGVAHTGGGLEYKTIEAGSNITITPGAGTITISASGSGSGTVTSFSAGNASPFFTSSVATATTTPALTFNVTSQNENTVCAGPTSGSAAAPTFRSLVASDFPSTTVNSSSNLSPIFTSSIMSQALSFSLSNAGAGTLLGNFSGSSGAPSYNSPGSADQVLGVAHSGGGLEYKTIEAGSNITITPGAGSITIAATGGGSGTVTNFSAGNAAPFFTSSVATATTTPALTFNVTSQNANTVCAGPTSGSAVAPTFRSLVAGDLPTTAVNSSGNLSPIFTSSIASQALSFSLSNAGAGTLLGNFSGSSGAPSYNSPGSADQVLGVAHSGGGLEYKTIEAGSNITITPGAGSITIAATGGSGFTNPMTTLGDIIYGASSGTATRLAGNTTTTPQVLFQVGSGTVSAAPTWQQPTQTDIASGTIANGSVATTQSPLDNSTKVATTAYVDAAVTAAGGPLLVTVSLTSAQIKGMYLTPVLVLTTPSGKSVIPIAAMIRLAPGSGFTGGGVVVLQENNTAHGLGNLLMSMAAAGLDTGGSDNMLNVAAALPVGKLADAYDIYISNQTAAFATTASPTATLYFWYYAQ
jgi:hypothetical protein